MFKLIATVRGGSTNSPLIARRYATMEEARAASKELMHHNPRITRVAVVADELPMKFVEFIERS
jgi:hypothetical protein